MPKVGGNSLGLIALDTETTGVDINHGARPFFVTVCKEDLTQLWWEWEVDPETRQVSAVKEDLIEIKDLLDRCDGVVLQNAKFDVKALHAAGLEGDWPWYKTYDTLLAGHLLASNQPHNLTDMALQYLGIDMQPYEDRIKEAATQARRYAKTYCPTYRIARADDDMMPSAKKSPWKYDMWLPKLLRTKYKEAGNDSWMTALQDYANADSSVTMALWKIQEREIRRRNLWAIYKERLKCLPVACKMESRGVTVSADRLTRLKTEYRKESERAGKLCVNIASGYEEQVCSVCGNPPNKQDAIMAAIRGELKQQHCEGSRWVYRPYELELPKSGNNGSLIRFCFGPLGLPELKCSYKTGEPSLDKSVLETYELTLPPRSKQLLFVQVLKGKRKRDTAISYMESYERFWLPLKDTELEGWYVLYPSLNPTGTDTLRWSSSNPNEQNISKQEGFNLRYCFGPAPGREWWSMDAKNIELRIPAYESGEQLLIDLFERPDEPPYYGSTHLLNFHTVYPDIWEQELREVGLENVGPHCKRKYASTWYQRCKNGGFAVQYGAIDREGGGGTADRAFGRVGCHAKLKERFSKLEKLSQYWIRYAERNGYVETVPDKTVDAKRGYPLLVTRTEYGKILPTVPLNYHVQGTAMWWMLKAMIRCQEQLDEWRSRDGLDAHIVLQVHDELVFDFPKGYKSNLPRVRILQRIMTNCGDDIGIPTPVSCEYHTDNWAEGVAV